MLSDTKLQVINLWNCCIWLVNLFELKSAVLFQYEILTVRKFAVGIAVLETQGHLLGKKSYLTSNYYQPISITQLSLEISGRQYKAKKKNLPCQQAESIIPKSDFSIAFCPGFSFFLFKRQSLWCVYSTFKDCYILFQMQMPSSQRCYHRNPIPSIVDIHQMISEPCGQNYTDR